jgi:phosphoglycolate phosphatase-like HAD superfamily hydrolase
MNEQLLGLVLDDSGVIGNHFAMVLECVNYVLNCNGRKPVDAGFLTNHFAMPETFYRRFFSGLDAKKCADMHRQHLQEAPMPEPLPGAVDAVAELYVSGMPLCVYSSHPEDKLIAEFEHWGISDFFARVAGGVDKNKSRDFIKMLKSTFRCSRGNIAYVGDTVVDFELARKAKVSFKYVPSDFQNSIFLRKHVSKECTFGSLKDLSDILV